jgi:hypothetical protein
MSSDIAVKNAPSAVGNYEEAVQNAKGDRRNGEEVHRCNRFSMIVQKG